MSNFPNSLDNNTTLPNPLPTDKTNAPSLSGLITTLNAAVIAVETKLGTSASNAVNNKLLIGTGAGTSAWTKNAPVGDIVGTTDSQSLSNKTLTSPSISSPVLSGTATGTYTFSNPIISGNMTGTFSINGTSTANLATTNTSQSLTNKTLSSGSVIDSNVDVTEVLKKVYPVGSIYIATVSTNPATLLGFGTWTAFAAGRTLVGVGTSDQAFTAGTTGGASNVTLTTAQMPVHNHGVNDPSHNHSTNDTWFKDAGGSGNLGLNTPGNRFAQGLQTVTVNGNYTGISIQNAGSGNSHNNLQPYIVTYMWQRTA